MSACAFVGLLSAMRLTHFFIASQLLIALPSCSSTSRLLKAGVVEPSPFFEQPWLAQNGGAQLPFQKVWTTPDRRLLAEGMKLRKLFIAPVSLAYLRPMTRTLSKQEVRWGGQRQEAAVARRLREEFTAAFHNSPRPLYQMADRPGPGTLTLQLALIELQPTSPKGNAVMSVLKFAVTPFAALGRFFTKGNIAIEGKVQMPGTGRAFFQFADNEQDKLTFLNTRDFQPYGHAVNTIHDWAVQFEAVTRAPRGMKVPDSNPMTLRLQ